MLNPLLFLSIYIPLCATSSFYILGRFFYTSSSCSFADASIQYVIISVANSNLIGESRCISTTSIRIPNKFIDSIIPHILPPFITVWISFIVVEVDVTVQHTMDFDSDFLFSNKSFQTFVSFKHISQIVWDAIITAASLHTCSTWCLAVSKVRRVSLTPNDNSSFSFFRANLLLTNSVCARNRL